MLRTGDFRERGRAVQALVALGGDAVRGEPSSVESLRSTLHHADPSVRISAAQVMGRLDIEAAPALDVLMGLIRDGTTGVRQAALYALLYFSDPPAALVTERIAGLDAGTDGGEIFASKMALIAIGGPAVPALALALEQGNPSVRRRSAAVLGGIRARYAGAVTGGEASPHWWAYASPVYAERTQKHLAAAIGALLVALRDEDHSVRNRAVDALACGAIARIPADILGAYLDALLDTGHPSAAFAMADALASELPPVVAMAAQRWPALDPALKVDIVRCARRDVEAEPAERAIRAIFSPSERVSALLLRPHEDRASAEESAETEWLMETLVRDGRFRT